MKAFTLLIPVLVFVSVAGCSKDNTDSNHTPAETQAPAPAPEYNAELDTPKDDVLLEDPADAPKDAEMTEKATEHSEEDPAETTNDFKEAED